MPVSQRSAAIGFLGSGGYKAPMPSRLTDIKIRFIAEQDRLLMQIGATEHDVVRLWLTRRFVSRFWGALVQSLENYPEVNALLAPHVRGAILSFEHQQVAQSGVIKEVHSGDSGNTGAGVVKRVDAAAKTNADTADELDATLPAMLVIGARCQPGKGSLTTLILRTVDGKDVTTNLNKTLLYGICHMLLTAQTQAEWNLGLDFGETAEPAQNQAVVH